MKRIVLGESLTSRHKSLQIRGWYGWYHPPLQCYIAIIKADDKVACKTVGIAAQWLLIRGIPEYFTPWTQMT